MSAAFHHVQFTTDVSTVRSLRALVKHSPALTEQETLAIRNSFLNVFRGRKW